MSKTDRFHSPKQRLRRGKEHIKRLKKRLGTFFQKEPYATVKEMDADGVTELHKFKLVKPVPDICTHYAAEALEAIRSALDQTGFAAAVAAGKMKPKKTAFPISDSAAELDNLINGRRVSKDIPDEIVTLFRSFKPYKGGNDIFWALNKLRNSTHTALVPIGFVSGGLKMNNVVMAAGPNSSSSIPVPRWDSEKNEMIFARIGPGGSFNYDAQFSLIVAFHHPEITDGPIAVELLDRAATVVHDVIKATEAECAKRGFTN